MDLRFVAFDSNDSGDWDTQIQWVHSLATFNSEQPESSLKAIMSSALERSSKLGLPVDLTKAIVVKLIDHADRNALKPSVTHQVGVAALKV
jgi:hypothetical protein